MRICIASTGSGYSDSLILLSGSVQVLGILPTGMFREEQLPGCVQGSFKSKPGKSSLVNVPKTPLGLAVTHYGLTQYRHNLHNIDTTLSHASGLTNALKLHQVLCSRYIESK